MSESPISSRRDFLKTSSVVAAGGALAGTLGISRSAHASVDDTIKVGLIGCGGRGTRRRCRPCKPTRERNSSPWETPSTIA